MLLSFWRREMNTGCDLKKRRHYYGLIILLFIMMMMTAAPEVAFTPGQYVSCISNKIVASLLPVCCWMLVTSSTSLTCFAEEIPAIIGQRYVNNDQLFQGHCHGCVSVCNVQGDISTRHSRRRVLRIINHRATSPVKVGTFNARSVSTRGNVSPSHRG